MNWNDTITSTGRLKTFTIIFHALIVVGMGHGILTMGILEFYFPFLAMPVNANVSGTGFSLNATFQNRLPAVLICIYAGQLLMLVSIMQKPTPAKRWTHIISLVFLLMSIVYFGNNTNQGISISYLSAIPFLICVLMVFLAKPLKKMVYRFWNWA